MPAPSNDETTAQGYHEDSGKRSTTKINYYCIFTFEFVQFISSVRNYSWNIYTFYCSLYHLHNLSIIIYLWLLGNRIHIFKCVAILFLKPLISHYLVIQEDDDYDDEFSLCCANVWARYLEYEASFDPQINSHAIAIFI